MAHDPYLNDPQRWGVSLAQSAEIMLPCLDAAGARSVVEVGAFAGDLTRVLVDWAAGAGARVGAVDPAPQDGLVALAGDHPELELIRETSLEALPRIPLPDAVVIDGDHNFHTVREELRILGERAPGAELPLLLFHDVRWPHGRRDDYFDADAIPAERPPSAGGRRRRPVPRRPGAAPRRAPVPALGGARGRRAQRRAHRRRGRSRPSAATSASRSCRRSSASACCGRSARGYADALAALLDPLDGHPVLERLEANRVHHLAQGHVTLSELWAERERRARQEALLRRLLESSAFQVAERLSMLRHRAGVATDASVISREEIRRVLED